MKKISTAVQLTDFLNRILPKFADTGKAKDLRRLDPDHNNRRAVIAWVGCPTMSEIWKYRITVNLVAHPLDQWASDEAVQFGKDLSTLLKIKLNPPCTKKVMEVEQVVEVLAPVNADGQKEIITAMTQEAEQAEQAVLDEEVSKSLDAIPA